MLYRFDVGGLENGVVNLINTMPESRFRHVVIALTDADPQFRERIARSDVDVISMHKPAGHGVRLYPGFYRLMRKLRPSVVHTRNLAALEMVVPAALAGVPVRVHGEHGWDSSDPQGTSPKYRLLRRAYSPFVTHYVGLSRHIERYLGSAVGISEHRVSRICNGVDARRFAPDSGVGAPHDLPFDPQGKWVFGTVGRLQEVKDQLTLVRAFAHLRAANSEARSKAHLIIAGDGPLRGAVEDEIARTGCGERVWVAGERSDITSIMAALDCFVLPSKTEGISNTILEAMAAGLPVLATDVGGNPELVADGETGWLVPSESPEAMSAAMAKSLTAPQQSRAYGTGGRRRIEAKFSLDAMVEQYAGLYDQLLAHRGRKHEADLA